MWPIVIDRVAWCVCQSVHLSVTIVSPAKMTELIEMPFGLRTQVGPRNNVLVLDEAQLQIPHGKGQLCGWKGRPIVNYKRAVQKQLNQSGCRLD